MTTTSINEGVVQTNDNPGSDASLDADDVASYFLNRWDANEEPSDSAKGDKEPKDPIETDEDLEEENEDDLDLDTNDDENEDTDDEDDEDAPKAKEAPPVSASDEALVSVTVDGVEQQVSVKDLKRLYGQEASLTRKSQEVAEKRKVIEAQEQKYVTGLNTLVEKAWKKLEPYTKIDFLVASKELETEEFAELRAAAQAADEEFKYLKTELDSSVENYTVRQKEQVKEAAKEAVKVLSSKEWWSQDTYDNIRTYAVSNAGLPVEEVNNYTNPAVIELIYKSMMYDRAKKVATEKRAKAPQKVLKSTQADASSKVSSKTNRKSDLVKLRSGDMDDIASAIMGRWEQ